MRAYIDDLLSGMKGVLPHLELLRQLFECLHMTGYKLSLKKCQFLMKQVDFVGSTVSGDGVLIQQSKLEAVRKLEIPQMIAQVKSLLGFTSFLRTHVPYYCDVVAPIQDFLMMPNATTNMKLDGLWTEEHDRSFAMMKDLLLDNRVLAFPNSSKLYILYTDASKKAMSGVLMQEADDVEHMTVVRLRQDRDQVFQDCDLYIGRQVKHGGWDLEESKWANPFKLTRKNSDGTEEANMTRSESLKRYQQHVLDSPELMASLHELKGLLVSPGQVPQRHSRRTPGREVSSKTTSHWLLVKVLQGIAMQLGSAGEGSLCCQRGCRTLCSVHRGLSCDTSL